MQLQKEELSNGLLIPLDILQILIQRAYGQLPFMFQLARCSDEEGLIDITKEGKAKLAIKLGLSKTRIQSLIIDAKKFGILIDHNANELAMNPRFGYVIKNKEKIENINIKEALFFPFSALNFFTQVGYGHIIFLLSLCLDSDVNGEFPMTPQTINKLALKMGVSNMRSRTLFMEGKKIKTIIQAENKNWKINPEKLKLYKCGSIEDDFF